MKKWYCFRLVYLFIGIFWAANVQGQTGWPVEFHINQLINRIPAGNHQELASIVQELEKIGEEGVLEICTRMEEPADRDDHRERMLLESLVRASTKDNRNPWLENCLLSAFVSTSSGSIKQFLLQAIIPVSTQVSVTTLSPLLQKPEYCSAIIRLFAYQPSDNYEPELLKYVMSGGTCKLEAAKLLATGNSDDIQKTLAALQNHENRELQIIARDYLARNGNSADWKHIKSQFSIQDQVTYANTLFEDGEITQANKVCKYLLKKSEQNHFRKSILDVMSHHLEADAFPMFKKILKSGPGELEGRAIQLGGEWPGKSVTRSWINLLPQVNQDAQINIIKMLGKRGDPLAFPVIDKYLRSSQPLQIVAALQASGSMTAKESLPGIEHLLRTRNSEIVQIALDQQIRQKIDESSLHKLWSSFADFPADNQLMLVNLVNERKIKFMHNPIKPLLNADNPEIREATWRARLSSLDPIYKNQVLQELGQGSSQQDRFRQAWLASHFSGNVASVNTILNSVDKSKQIASFELLAKLGGIHAANALAKMALASGKVEVDSAFQLLGKWPDGWAVEGLFEISKKYPNLRDPGIDLCLKYLRYNNWNTQQRRLKLEKLMDLAMTLEQKKNILQQWSGLRGDIMSVFTLNKWLDDEQIESEAALAVLKIVTPPSGRSVYPISSLGMDAILTKAAERLRSAKMKEDYNQLKDIQEKYKNQHDYVSLFNGVDLTGWKGLVGNPISRDTMQTDTLAMKQKLADIKMRENWSVKNGTISFSGHGQNMLTEKEYRDFELLVDWRITKDGDSGIYLRGTPQVQIWDTARVNSKVGSGGLYNNKIGRSTPLQVADHPVGDWNHFKIRMIDDRVSVWFNGILVVDEVTLENYWDYDLPIFREGYIELQAHGTDLAFRHIYLKELEEKNYHLTEEEIREGFVSLFNGKNLDGWVGNKTDYVVENGDIAIYPHRGGSGNLFTKKEYDNFTFKFEFQLTPGANNGLGIHTARTGDAAYQGKEIQILDNTADVYRNLKPYQYHGSVYGILPAKRGFLRPVGEWNEEEVTVNGSHIQVRLNGTVIVDDDYLAASRYGTMDGRNHPGLQKMKGHIGFLGHGSVVRFRNIRILEK